MSWINNWSNWEGVIIDGLDTMDIIDEMRASWTWISINWAGFQNKVAQIIETPNFFDTIKWEFTFKDVLIFIDENFDFNYSPFSIWNLKNRDPAKTTGSCKVLAYAHLLWPNISPRWVLDLFWEHYNSLFEERDGKKVLKNGIDHPNIRALITHWLEWVKFEWDFPLTPKVKK